MNCFFWDRIVWSYEKMHTDSLVPTPAVSAVLNMS